MPDRRSAALGIWIARSSRDDTPAEAGYSHLLVHLIYRDIDRHDGLLPRLGGDINACASRELIVFHGTAPGDRLDALASLLSVRLHRPVFGGPFRDSDLAVEQTAVLHEIAGNQGPSLALEDQTLTHVWPGHPIARPVTGDPDAIRRATAQSLRTCLNGILQGPNLSVLATGAIHHDLLVEVCRPLARLPPGGAPDAPAPIRSAPAACPANFASRSDWFTRSIRGWNGNRTAACGGCNSLVSPRRRLTADTRSKQSFGKLAAKSRSRVISSARRPAFAPARSSRMTIRQPSWNVSRAIISDTEASAPSTIDWPRSTLPMRTPCARSSPPHGDITRCTSRVQAVLPPAIDAHDARFMTPCCSGWPDYEYSVRQTVRGLP